MKTKEELESLKKELAQLKSKLVELTDDELAKVAGGFSDSRYPNVTIIEKLMEIRDVNNKTYTRY